MRHPLYWWLQVSHTITSCVLCISAISAVASIDLRCCFSQDHLLEYQTVSKYNARFDGLQAGTSYDIQISTELAGKTVVQTRHTFKTVTDTQEETRTDQN